MVVLTTDVIVTLVVIGVVILLVLIIVLVKIESLRTYSILGIVFIHI